MDNNVLAIIAAVLISGIIFIPLGVLIRKKIAESKIAGAENEAKRLIEMAKVEAENKKKEEIFKAREEIMQARDELDREVRERRGELQVQERRLIQKEENLERRAENYENNEKQLEIKSKELEEKGNKVNELIEEQMQQLQKLSGLTKEEAKTMLLSELEEQIKLEKAQLIKEMDAKAREEMVRNAKEILTYSIQKCAADHTSETTVSIVSLPSDEMKGRIIGREGRNIKTT